MDKNKAKGAVGEQIYNAKRSLEAAQKLMESIIDKKLVEVKTEYKDCTIQSIAPLVEVTPADGEEHVIEVVCVHTKTASGFNFSYRINNYAHCFTHTATR